jgi:hypothetical protein
VGRPRPHREMLFRSDGGEKMKTVPPARASANFGFLAGHDAQLVRLGAKTP